MVTMTTRYRWGSPKVSTPSKSQWTVQPRTETEEKHKLTLDVRFYDEDYFEPKKERARNDGFVYVDNVDIDNVDIDDETIPLSHIEVKWSDDPCTRPWTMEPQVK